jgi:hypothetical protein
MLMVYLVDWIAKGNLKLTLIAYFALFVLYGYTLWGFLNEVAGRGEYIFPYKFFFNL